jgi:hypothetical protein
VDRHVGTGFAPALLGGLAELGPVDPFSGDLSLELGVSVWLRRSGASLGEACERLHEARAAILEACGLDPDTEPVPMVGRSPRLDVVNLAAYVGDLLRRAAAGVGWSVQTVAARAVTLLPEPADEALGA